MSQTPSFSPFNQDLSNIISVNISGLSQDERISLPRCPTRAGVTGLLVASPDLTNRRNAILTASLFERNPEFSFNQQELVSAVINITLSDGQGNSVTQLDSPLTICLVPSNSTIKSDEACLGFYDVEKGRWKCEDKCLATISSKGLSSDTLKENLLCGQTSHLTNFALLLQGNEAKDPCQTDSDNTLAWTSLGMVAGALLLVGLSVLVIEVHYRWKRRQIDRELTKTLSKVAFK